MNNSDAAEDAAIGGQHCRVGPELVSDKSMKARERNFSTYSAEIALMAAVSVAWQEPQGGIKILAGCHCQKQWHAMREEGSATSAWSSIALSSEQAALELRLMMEE